jgi:glycosyltransferase involved in cell wall biosynthesis
MLRQRRESSVGVSALEAFILFHAQHSSVQLIIAGGASLLDHDAYRVRFRETLAASGLPPWAVIEAGPIPQADMSALYRIADALVFPSPNEGFGLVVLEAMASERPVIVSRIAPFTEYLGEDDAAWCDPANPASISAAITTALTEPQRTQFIQRGWDVARRHDWLGTARAHLATYNALKEPTDA